MKANRYQYNGKEFIEEVGLNDYGARWYDPAIARWTAVDPLAELIPAHSPYAYTFNNPSGFNDPTGMMGQSAQELVQQAWDDTPEGENRTYTYNSEDADENEEDCCLGMDVKARQAESSLLAKHSDRSQEEWHNDILDAEMRGAEQYWEGFLFAIPIERVLIAGKWVYRFVKARQAARASAVVAKQLTGKAKNALINGKIEGAVEILSKGNLPRELENAVIINSAQFITARSEYMAGRISYETYVVERNNVVNSLLWIIDKI